MFTYIHWNQNLLYNITSLPLEVNQFSYLVSCLWPGLKVMKQFKTCVKISVSHKIITCIIEWRLKYVINNVILWHYKCFQLSSLRQCNMFEWTYDCCMSLGAGLPVIWKRINVSEKKNTKYCNGQLTLGALNHVFPHFFVKQFNRYVFCLCLN